MIIPEHLNVVDDKRYIVIGDPSHEFQIANLIAEKGLQEDIVLINPDQAKEMFGVQPLIEDKMQESVNGVYELVKEMQRYEPPPKSGKERRRERRRLNRSKRKRY